jgi:hypothetical protein
MDLPGRSLATQKIPAGAEQVFSSRPPKYLFWLRCRSGSSRRFALGSVFTACDQHPLRGNSPLRFRWSAPPESRQLARSSGRPPAQELAGGISRFLVFDRLAGVRPCLGGIRAQTGLTPAPKSTCKKPLHCPARTCSGRRGWQHDRRMSAAFNDHFRPAPERVECQPSRRRSGGSNPHDVTNSNNDSRPALSKTSSLA